MSAWIDANIEGVALLIVFGTIGIVVIVLAMLASLHFEPRSDRGEFNHQARVAAAKRQMTLRSNER